ncbi:hypothetical protein HWQ46_26750 [Shewanella sp. D64]|uniref:hypothetical protein n=1 Tax=unclassified Shewanella TaxID=196818 RepID=UPI0022BA537F|nr:MULTISPECIES: hypothetical protein [unclassified Shewanella]MEC4729107.1 hypothetical protein [Shewanella sp. D64]MEC4740901.1 hypothetical protein [Shewanella sp. E94]MEC4740921.1 hypothetical protein [Shewanella sp. E94]WBJ95302.1 hypothetical protein HWQ47_26535 [Shewanella sp. MTB7]
MINNPEFRHLIKHYRHYKIQLRYAISIYRGERTVDSALDMAVARGALECLYSQALGKGLLNLAKGIQRTIKAATRYVEHEL